MPQVSAKAAFLESLERCKEFDGFIPSFYERFLGASEEIRELFKETDFERQNQMLLRSLELSAAATAGEPQGLREINERARTHSRDHLNIRPALYDVWLEAIVATAGEFDPQWTTDTEQAWRRILGFVVKHMVSRY